MPDLALATTPERAFLTFYVQGRRYGIALTKVREVSTHVACTPVPQAPPVVRGLTSLRSRIHLVLDAGVALHGQPTECTAESRLVVLHEGVAAQFALLVERGGDIVHAGGDLIEPAADARAAEPTPDADPVIALCKLRGELMMVIEPAALVAGLEAATRGRPTGAPAAAAAGETRP
ncbi:MAG: chemotaxis protein CheW [Planctomycetota bacterium]